MASVSADLTHYYDQRQSSAAPLVTTLAAADHACVYIHREEPNTIMIHIRMLDSTAQLQQEALGVLGVNFIHAALTMGSDISRIINSLFSDLSRSRMEVQLAAQMRAADSCS